MMKLLLSAAFLAFAFQDTADFPKRLAGFERDLAGFLRDDAVKLQEVQETEAAQVFASIAAWLAPDLPAIVAAERGLRDKVLALTAPVGRRLDSLRKAADLYTDSLRMGPVGRVGLKSAPARAARSRIAINIGWDKIYITGDACSRESDGRNIVDLLPPAPIFASDDEILVLEGGRVSASPTSETALRSGADVLYKKARAWGVEAQGLKRAADVQRLTVLTEMLFTLRHSVRALWRLNDHRFAARQKPAAYSAGLSAGCLLHARYLACEKPEVIVGLKAHTEVVTSAWFTKEGSAAGVRSVISSSSIDYAVDELIATFYHRIPMIAPGLELVGFGEWTTDWQPRSVIDVHSGAVAKPGIVFYPADGADGVFTRFPSRELPNPMPEDTVLAGFPITLAFHGRPAPKGVKATLTEDPAGTAVDCWISSPEQAANPIQPENMSTVCLIPKRALKADRTYVARITGTLEGESKTWTSTFKTRKKAFTW